MGEGLIFMGFLTPGVSEQLRAAMPFLLISVKALCLHTKKIKHLNEHWLITVWLNESLFILEVCCTTLKLCRAVYLIGARTPKHKP